MAELDKPAPIITILLPLVLFGLCSCAMGPLTLHETARTVGRGKSDALVGYGSPGYSIKYNYGLLRSLDVGLQFETFSLGARMKYAFIDRQSRGMSMAVALGAGSSIGGTHEYGDLIISDLDKWWEPYGAFRYVHVDSDKTNVQDVNGDLVFTIPNYSYNYGQFILGSRFWFNQKWFLSTEASTLMSLTSDLHFSDNLLLSVAIGYRFL